MAETVKNPPEKQVTWVQSLDGEDPLEKGMATHSSILPWRIPWTEELNVLQSMGWQRVRHDWVTNTQPSLPTWSRSRWRLWKSGLTLFKVSLIAKVFAGLESWLVSWCPPEVGRECFTGQRMQQSSPSGPDGPNHRRCLYQCTAEPGCWAQLWRIFQGNPSLPSALRHCLSSQGRGREIRVLSSSFRPFWLNANSSALIIPLFLSDPSHLKN